MSERNKLVARLERAGEYEPLGHDGWEAADQIERDGREIDRLRQQIADNATTVEAAREDLTISYLAGANSANEEISFWKDRYHMESRVRIRAQEALTPSAENKYAYSGEFSWTDWTPDENGIEQGYERVVPWTTIKEIMAAIRTRAVLNEEAG